MTVVVVIEGLVIALLALLVVGLLRSHAEILKRLHQLGVGLEPDEAPAPARAGSAPPGPEGPRPGRDFQVMPQVPSPPDREGFTGAADLSGADLSDGAVSLRVNGVEHDTIVAFLSSGCMTCQRFWEAFRKPKKLRLPRGTRLVIVTKGPHDESPSTIAKVAPPGVPLVMSNDAWEDYDVPGSPYFVLVHGPSGRVRGEGTGPDWEQVQSLLDQANGDADPELASNRVRKPSSDAEREARVDRELLAAGIAPGDPSLYEAPVADVFDDDGHDHPHDHGTGR